MPGQVYRCTECPESWEYHPAGPGFVLDDEAFLLGLVDVGGVFAIMPHYARNNMRHFMQQWATTGQVVESSTPAQSSGYLAAIQRRHAEQIANSFEVPPQLVYPEEPPVAWGLDPSVPGVTAALSPIPGTPGMGERTEISADDAAALATQEADELLTALRFAAGNPRSERANEMPGMAEARRRGYVREITPGRRTRQAHRVALTGFGTAALLRLRRAQPPR